jgi:activating signal cointegrator complex subunit 2
MMEYPSRMIPLAPFHIPAEEDNVSSSDWNSCVEAWRFVLRSYLILPSKKFSEELRLSDTAAAFLVSYLHELQIHGNKSHGYPLHPALHYECFVLIHRAWLEAETPPALLHVSFLKNFCWVYGDNPGSAAIMERLWTEKNLSESQSVLKDKEIIQQQLEAASVNDAKQLHQPLLETRAFAKVCHEYGKLLMVGADFLDALIAAWRSTDPRMKKNITLVTYAVLLSLTHGEEPRLSTLHDHLYTLRMDHEQASSKFSLLADIVTATPFLLKYRRMAMVATSGRFSDMLPHLEKVGSPPSSKRTVSKGKQPIRRPSYDVELRESAAISQIHELFPELGLGYIARLLNDYNFDTEEVTAHLLDHSLPAHLLDASRDENMQSYQDSKADQGTSKALAESERRNAFDHDKLDHLQVSVGNLHFGKKPEDDTLSKPFDKNATLAALAALNSDDDERDDTYDAEDVGGTVDVENPEHDQRESTEAMIAGATSEAAEAALFQTWRREPELFSRKPTTRNSRVRAELREKSGWSDEQIEGWAIMLQREPKRVKKLRDKNSDDYYLRQGDQDGADESDGNSNDFDGDRAGPAYVGRGQGRPPQGNRGRGGRAGGNVAGPAHERSTQMARQRKDTNKASRGNHNRRTQRAKKMAGGM